MPPAPHPSRTRLLEAAFEAFRSKGYHATRIEDVCAAAGLTKGGFFHHFRDKEELAVAAAEHWSEVTGGFFAGASYHRLADPLDRVLGYVDFRKAILAGPVSRFTCLVGTLVQETYDTHPAIRSACDRSISGHAAELAKDLAEARRLYAPDAPWDAGTLALYTQAVLQGAFILAKARGGAREAAACLDLLRNHLELLFGRAPRPA